MPLAIWVDFSQAAEPSIAKLNHLLPQFFDRQMCPNDEENKYIIHQAPRRTKKSIQTLAEHLKELISWREQNNITVRDFSNTNLEYYLEAQCCHIKPCGKNLSWNTINSRYTSAHRFLAWCNKTQLNLDYNSEENTHLTSKTKGRQKLKNLPYRKTQEPTRFLLLADAVELIKELETKSGTDEKLNFRNALIARLMLQCGLRLTEAVTFPIGDLPDLNYNEHSTAARVVGKGRKARTILIPNRLLADLWLYADTIRALQLEDTQHSSLPKELFIGSKGQKISSNWISKLITDSAKKLKITATPHTLRHTFGTYHYLTNKDIITLSKIMGHEAPATTEKFYVHLAALTIYASNYEEFQKTIDRQCGSNR